MLIFMKVDAGFRENDQIKHAELLITVFARLIVDVLVLIVIHQAEPLYKWIASHFSFVLRSGLGCVKLLALILHDVF